MKTYAKNIENVTQCIKKYSNLPNRTPKIIMYIMCFIIMILS